MALHTRALLWEVRQQISDTRDGIRCLTSQPPTWGGEAVSGRDRRSIMKTLRERMRQDENFARYLLRKAYDAPRGS
jgi:hypothetical protein